jgi:hypothetical protein
LCTRFFLLLFFKAYRHQCFLFSHFHTFQIKPKPRHAPPKPILKESNEGGAFDKPSAAAPPKLVPSASKSEAKPSLALKHKHGQVAFDEGEKREFLSKSGGGGGSGSGSGSGSLPPFQPPPGTLPATSPSGRSELLDVFSSFDSHKPPQQPQPGMPPEQLKVGNQGEMATKRRRFMSMEGRGLEASDEGVVDPSSSSAAMDALLDGVGLTKGVGLLTSLQSGAPPKGVVDGGAKSGGSKKIICGAATLEEEKSPKFKLRGEGNGSKSGSGASEGHLDAALPSSSQIQCAAEALSLDESSGLAISLPPFNASLSLNDVEGGSTTFFRGEKRSRGGVLGQGGGEEEGGKDDQDGMNLSTGGGESNGGGKDGGAEEK